MDKELQSRSGRNIGIESALLPFVQAAAAEVFVIPESGAEVTVMEHTAEAARVPFAACLDSASSSGANGGGYLFNNGAPSLGIVVFSFVDELGNEILIGGGPALPLSHIFYGPAGTFFCLAPGEKIVARVKPH